MKIKKSSNFWNPLSVDNKYELNNIKIFDPKSEKVLYEHDSGWFDNVGEIFLPALKRKIKLNLSVNHSFFIKEYKKQSVSQGYCLYISKDDVNFRFDRNDIKYQTETDIHYADFFKFDLDCVLNDNKGVFTIQVTKHTKTEQKDFGKEVDFWMNKLKEDNITIDSYDLKKLLSKYKLLQKV